MPFLSFNVHMAPLSKVDDGCNDIVALRRANGGRWSLIRTLLSMESGDYFNLNEQGEVEYNMPLDYIKAKTWELNPRIKAPRPVD